MSERLLTEDEAAELLAVPVSWVRESTRPGRCRACGLAGTWGSSLPPWRRGSRSAGDPGGRSCCGGPRARL